MGKCSALLVCGLMSAAVAFAQEAARPIGSADKQPISRGELKQKVDVLYRRKKVTVRLTQTHIRLIIMELREDEDFLDGFSNQKYSQYDFFKAIVRKHCDIEEYIIDSVHDRFKQ